MRQTVNNGLDATEFWGNDVNEIVKQLRECRSYDAMVDIICRFIEQRFDQNCRPEEPIDSVAIQMLDPLKNYSPEEWAAMACLSLRQFERNFMTRVGISPKLFIRIVRFEYAMKIKNNCPDKSWSQIAMECGYTDSSHLLKEFKEFAEFPPSRFYLQPTSGYSEFPTG
jgi:AraC-like DNA-binding protein